MAPLSENEKKQIRRYCVYPKVALVALVMAFVTCLMLVPLEMIDDLVFHHKGFQDTGLNVILALVAVNLVAFCFWTLRPKFGMRGKQWRALQARLAVSQQETDRSAQVAAAIGAQAAGRLLSDSDSDLAKGLGGVAQVAGAVGTVLTVADILSETSANAEAMAGAYGVPVPNARRWRVALVVLPIVIAIGAYAPQYAQASRELDARVASAAERIGAARDALAGTCARVSADDPRERYKDSGYHVIGYLREREDGVQESYVYLDFDDEGTLTDVSYCTEVDVNATLEESLDQAMRDIAELGAALEGLDVPTSNAGLLAVPRVPDDFRETFLAGSPYESIRTYSDDDPVKTSCSFDTEPEEEFDQYTHPSIRVSLRT